MTRFTALVRFVLPSTLALLAASACGGQSFTRGSDGNTGGDSGSGSGGSGNHAGSGSAGKGHGGSVGTAGSVGTGGSVGTSGAGYGGSVGTGGSGFSGNVGTAGFGAVGGYDEGCDAPPEVGQCEAAVESWYHDPSTGLCRPFTYGGCGGNANRYSTLQDCQKACPNVGRPNFDACKVPTDCMVTGTGCCGICDGPNISAHDLIAINQQYANAVQCSYALESPPSDGASAPIACAPCLAPAPGQGSLAYFVPDCVKGQCVVQDIRNTAATACKTQQDCRVRHGSQCCESCGNYDLIAVSNDGSLEQLVCGGGPVGCLACEPQASNAVALCGASGHCALGFAL